MPTEKKLPQGKPPYDVKVATEERIAVIGEGNHLEPTAAASQTRRIAQALAYKIANWDHESKIDAIEEALKQRDEQAIGIAKQCQTTHCWRMHGPRLSCGCYCHEIIRLIRNSDSEKEEG